MARWGASRAVAAKPDIPELSPARRALVDHQATLNAVQAEADATTEAIARLREIIDRETAAEAAHRQFRQDHAQLLARWAESGGTGAMPGPDASEHARVEKTLAEERRNAAAARAAIVQKEASLTEIGTRLAAMVDRTTALKLAVLVEAAGSIGNAYLAAIVQAARLASVLRGLNEVLVQSGRRVTPPGRSEMIGLDVGPVRCGEVHGPGFAVGVPPDATMRVSSWGEAAQRWRTLFEALDTDPSAELPKEERP